MSYTFDFFVGKLTCPVCGYTCGDRESTNMQTKICKVPGMNFYGIGDKIYIDYERIALKGYILIKRPEVESDFSLILEWECPNCDEPYNWARIAIRDEMVASIDNIELNKENIAMSNFISDECVYFGWEIDPNGIVKNSNHYSKK
jgi:hypothetical protein